MLRTVAEVTPTDAIIVNEGANTMDIYLFVFKEDFISLTVSTGRTMLPNCFPRHRLDSGVLGTMGVGLGYAIAAAATFPEKKIVAVEGDSAFGFSGMEVEVACRYNLNIVFIILNNNGIYRGSIELPSGFVTTFRLIFQTQRKYLQHHSW